MASDRRRFLVRAAAALVGAAGLAALALWGFRRPRGGAPDADPLASALRRQFADFGIGDELIARFASDHARYAGAALRYDVPDRVDPLGAFLLSTDFFQNGADASRPLRYVRYYDPYVSPCYNPLARRA